MLGKMRGLCGILSSSTSGRGRTVICKPKGWRPSLVKADGDEGCGILGILFLFVFPVAYVVWYLVKVIMTNAH